MSRDQADDAGTFTRATRLLRKNKLTCDEANQLIEIIEEMIKTKLDGRIKLLTWMVGIGLTLIVALLGAVIAIAVSGNPN